MSVLLFGGRIIATFAAGQIFRRIMNNITEQDKTFIRQAIGLATENVRNGGGPFGAVICRDGQVLSTGVNRVTDNNDPTAHAEVQAIRAACARLHTFDLSGCTLYTSCEPCPMCLGAIYWARLDRVVYAATQDDAASVDFDDSFIYKEIAKPMALRSIPFAHFDDPARLEPFTTWKDCETKTAY